MGDKRLKRLDVQLPEEHPIFQYPKGIRSKVAREWLDIGARLSEIKEIALEIKDMLGKKPKADESKKGGFDEKSFAKKITDFFG